MKQVIFAIFFFFPVSLFAQLPATDTIRLVDSTDSSGQMIDSLHLVKDSSLLTKDTTTSLVKPAVIDTYSPMLQRAFQRNPVLSRQGKAVATISRLRPAAVQDLYFYVILSVLLLLAFLRFFYSRYFNNMFQVFFNTSLRQGQLTDQLLQAKQASLLFNLLFAITGGLYIFFLIGFSGKAAGTNPVFLMSCCILGLASLYFLKYVSLKITGWLTGNRSAANTYLFIIFLINKILSILLLPFVIVIAFGDRILQYPAIVVSMLVIALMFFLRFVRSYVLLQHQIKVSRLHFFMYIIGVELLPLLLIYKGLLILLNKNL